jgi:hypothetical protein
MSSSNWGEEEKARRDALAALERLIADAPPCTVDEAMAALRSVVALRDRLTAARRGDDASPELDRKLERVNAVLSLVWSGAVPIVGFRRKHLVEAHAALAAAPGEEPQHAA